ncbi:MAG: hypothetical protein CMG42_02965, partial [Candidatus Marinimicrobia bacterium]|nr:hypothetical protein [Candidatus Neomarinimicrobiota bacterium]
MANTILLSKNSFKMNSRLLASIISFIFHPMLISLAAFLLLIYSSNPIPENANSILAICFVFSNLIPIATVLILKKRGIISDLDASQKEQRIFPLTLGIIYSGIAFLILTYMQANPLVRGLMFCYMTNTIITILITRYWKISIHAMGVGGPIAVLWLAEFQYPIPALLILIAVSYSRVILKAHTILQAVAGALLGLVLTY